jgi:hypothetical protein
LPALLNALQAEKNAGLGRLEPLDLRLQQLQQRTNHLAENLRAGPAAEDDRADELALELEAITTAAAKLEEEINTIHRQRMEIDTHRQQARARHSTLLQSLPPNNIPENIVPILQHLDTIFKEADEERGRQDFSKSEEYLDTAVQFTELGGRLFQTGQELERLVEIRTISPLADQITPVLNQWPPLIKQSHQLTQSQENLSAGIHAATEMAGRIQAQAQHILANHQQALNQIEARAEQALDNLAAAWDKVLAITPLTGPDPLAQSYHALWPKREAARGIPRLLEDFIVDAGQLTRQIDATRANLQDHQRHMQETLGRLPAILAAAQKTAEGWLCLQRLAEQLAALRVSLENQYQHTFTANTIEEINKRTAEFQQQVDQLYRVQETLRLESTEIDRLDNLIRDHWEAIQENPAGLSEAKISRAVKMTDAQYERAISAERSQDARAALEKCLSFVETLALN